MGLIALSPYDQQPKIKIYREDPTTSTTTAVSVLPPCKGDCLLCYNSEDSVKLAIDILHDGYIRPNYQVSVTRAEFTPSNTSSGSGGSTTAAAAVSKNMHRPSLSQAQVTTIHSVNNMNYNTTVLPLLPLLLLLLRYYYYYYYYYYTTTTTTSTTTIITTTITTTTPTILPLLLLLLVPILCFYLYF